MLRAGDRKQAGALQVLNSGSAEGFHLLKRARHVASEAARVWQFRGVCEGSAPAPEKLAQLGTWPGPCGRRRWVGPSALLWPPPLLPLLLPPLL